MTDDARLRAILSESLQNERQNPAVAADTQYRPAEWTAEQEAELVQRIHGTEAERLDRLITEANERGRHA